LPQEFHTEIVRQIIAFNLSSKQVKELCESDGTETTEQETETEPLPASAVKMAKVTQAGAMTSAQDLARAMMRQEGDINLARARLQTMQKLLTDAERYLVED
jgi:hypothetical protein